MMQPQVHCNRLAASKALPQLVTADAVQLTPACHAIMPAATQILALLTQPGSGEVLISAAKMKLVVSTCTGPMEVPLWNTVLVSMNLMNLHQHLNDLP
jgi:hypothetical protein